MAQIPRAIHKWTAIKLEHLDAYLQAYVKATKKSEQRYYIDAFAGCGDCVLVENQRPLQGSPWRALETIPPFSAYYFIERSRAAAEHLRQRIQEADVPNAHVFTGDCNDIIPTQVLPRVSKQAPSFAFLDPTGLQLNWSTVVQLAAHRSESRFKMELLILYPYDMAINRALSWQRAYPALDRFYGNRRVWQSQLEASQLGEETATQRRGRFLKLYEQRLRELEYRFVDCYGPLYDRRIPKYHVVFAGDNEVGARIMRDVWSRTRLVPGELGYVPLRRPRG